MDLQTIKDRIIQHLPDAEVQIEDVNGDGSHFSAWVKSNAFAGKSRVQQHQIVYAALGQDALKSEIHAIALKTSTFE